MRTRWNTSVYSSSIWNLEVLVFKERGKPQYPEKTSRSKGENQQHNSTHIWGRRQDSHLGHIGGRRVLSPLWHPCSRANWTTKPNGSKSWVIKLIFLKGPLMALEAWPKALQCSSRGSSKKGKREPCMAKKVMLKFATCTIRSNSHCILWLSWFSNSLCYGLCSEHYLFPHLYHSATQHNISFPWQLQ